MENLREGAQTKVPVSAEEQLAAMRQGVATTGEIRFRGYPIFVRVLAAAEIDQLRVSARKTAQIAGADDASVGLQIQSRTLMLATTINGVPQLSEKVLGLLTLDELNFLYEEWIAFADRSNPSLQEIEEADFRVLVDALKKNTVSTKDLSLRHLRAICSAYADLIRRPATPASPPAS